MAIEARKQLFAIAEREGIAFDLERRGILHIYHDKPGFDAGLRVNSLLQEGGLERFAVTSDEIRNIEPALRGNYYGGFFTPSEFNRRHPQIYPGIGRGLRQARGAFHPRRRGHRYRSIRAGLRRALVGGID